MRMWMVKPELLCDRHLLGEHGEIHKFRHVFEKGHSIHGRLFPVVQIEILQMKKRHDLLVEEMLRRGMNHKSLYLQPDLRGYRMYFHLKVDLNISLNDLSDRCVDCKRRMEYTQK